MRDVLPPAKMERGFLQVGEPYSHEFDPEMCIRDRDVPDIDSYIGLMHTLFTLEDRYGLEVCECEDEAHLRVHIHKGRDA